MKIFKGNVPWKDSFQELSDLWSEQGLCQMEKSNDKFSWMNEIGDVLLHEHDRITNLPNYKIGLFANQTIKNANSKAWIYWPRYPRKVNKFLKENTIKKIEERTIESIFIGCAENYIQYVNRTKYDWNLAVEKFDFNSNFSSNPHKYSNEDFLQLISKSKFGLSLEGYGPKCQRDIEYMALGVVPIFTWNSFNDYYDPLVENKHYIYAKNPREAIEKIKSINNNQWQEMSFNCIQWYNKNCSIEGSFETTLKTIT